MLAPSNAAATEADLLINGTMRADVKRVALHSNVAGQLSKGARQVGEGGTVYWVKLGDAKGSTNEMRDFLKNFTPKDKKGNVIKNVKIEVLDENELPKVLGN